MAYKMSDVGGFGTGALGDITNPSGQINSYANVTAISANTVTIGTPSNGIYETFAVGKEIMLHVSAITSGTDYQYLGKYMVGTITAVAGSVLTLSKDVSGLIASGVLANHHVQAITVAQFATLNLSATIAPLAYNFTNKYGGIIAIKCKTALNLSGSARVDLVGKGIPIANISARPATLQEGTAAQIGWENHITARQFYLNCPDGAAFIAAATVNNTGITARIGAATAGVANYPYYGGTVNTPVIGGATIMLISPMIVGFDVSLIAKASSNTSGRGLGRCYIATETKLAADERLYALDCLSNPARLVDLGIKDYGSGALGTVASINGQINSYVNVSGISADGKTLNIGTIYEGVYEKFAVGNLVMFHVSRATGANTDYTGKFFIRKILSITSNIVVLDKPVIGTAVYALTANYSCQLVTIAQFDILTCSTNYTGAKYYNETHGCGGILAIAAKTSFDLSDGILNMWAKGLGSRPVIPWQCSGQQQDCLPISQSSGAVFLLANKLITNSASRIGTSLSGINYAGNAGLGSGPYENPPPTVGGPGGCGYGGGGGGQDVYAASPGGPGGPGQILRGGDGGGGPAGGAVGMNGGPAYYVSGAPAGASIFVVGNEIVGFTIATYSTGGFGGDIHTGSGTWAGTGAGGPGTCFIYANILTNPDFTAYLAS